MKHMSMGADMGPKQGGCQRLGPSSCLLEQTFSRLIELPHISGTPRRRHKRLELLESGTECTECHGACIMRLCQGATHRTGTYTGTNAIDTSPRLTVLRRFF
jgi:hypothetical protein